MPAHVQHRRGGGSRLCSRPRASIAGSAWPARPLSAAAGLSTPPHPPVDKRASRGPPPLLQSRRLSSSQRLLQGAQRTPQSSTQRVRRRRWHAASAPRLEGSRCPATRYQSSSPRPPQSGDPPCRRAWRGAGAPQRPQRPADSCRHRKPPWPGPEVIDAPPRHRREGPAPSLVTGGASPGCGEYRCHGLRSGRRAAPGGACVLCGVAEWHSDQRGSEQAGLLGVPLTPAPHTDGSAHSCARASVSSGRAVGSRR